MKVKVIHRSEKRVEECDYAAAIELTLETKTESKTVSFYDGEPEDNSISRNFNDVYSIEDLIIMAYKAGRREEDVSITTEESDDI
jgi:hypothetical protein